MPRIFHRVISFDVKGELYDNDTAPESILRNYSWTFHKDNTKLPHEISIVGKHHDVRGEIVSLRKLSKIGRSSTIDSDYFVI